jgi:capsular exopolysaccharide synthesis family protein
VSRGTIRGKVVGVTTAHERDLAYEPDLAYSPLRGYLAAVRRRWWYMVVAVVVTPAVAVAYSLTQPDRYEATAKVLLSRQDVAAALGGTASQVYQDPNRLAQTQLEIARVPELAQRVIRQNGLQGETAESFLADSRVVAAANADILEFSVTASQPEVAETLATAYAVAFTRYRSEVASTAYARALRGVQRRLTQLKASGDGDTRLYESLLERREQLRTVATLGTQDAVLLRAADEATRVQPRPLRNGILAGLLGLLLGGVAVAVAEALDTRTRSSGEIAAALRLPLIGRVPESAFKQRKRAPLAMLRAPSGPEGEAFRIVRANLELLLRNTDRRIIMVTSARAVEGKSLTVSNLAVALALAGRHVVAVDLDLRRPSLSSLFGVPSSPGVSEVASGDATLEEALVPALLKIDGSQNGRTAFGGRLEVLPAGAPTPDPGELVGRDSIHQLLHRLRSRADVVLVDAPPLLQVGDAVTLSAAVDAVLLVVRADVASRDQLHELSRALTSTQVDTLGFVLAGSRPGETAGYGRYSAVY